MKFLVLLTLIFLVINPRPVSAAETYQNNQTIFTENFNSDLHQWTLEQGQSNMWTINNGTLLAQDEGTLKSGRLNTSGLWDNYALELDLNNLNGVDEGVGFRRTDGDNTYEITLRHGNGEFNTPEIILVKVQNGINTIIQDTHTIELKNQQWYHLKIEIFQQHLQVFLDNQIIFDLDDSQPLKTGGISLSYWTGDLGRASVRFDNVIVNTISKNLYPVIFIPGISGSELQTKQDIIWSQNDGHGGTYSHAYPGQEKVWINATEALIPGDQDYFDILKLKNDTQTSNADIIPNGHLVPYGYPDIDTIFSDLGYTKNTNYFLFAYDWRLDAMSQTQQLSTLIKTALETSHQPQVNIVTHSFGGLVARGYLTTPEHIQQVHKLIEMGVPHLGAVDSLKNLVHGETLGKNILQLFTIGINSLEVKDVIQNFTSVFELLPSSDYFRFYSGQATNPLPFRDQNQDHNFQQLISWLTWNSFNSNALSSAQSFHLLIDPLNQLDLKPIQIYEIVGAGQATLGQLIETYYITWPIQLIPKVDQIFINGDGTVPLYSAALKSDQLDLSTDAKIFYVEQNHQQLMQKGGFAWDIAAAILNQGDPPNSPPEPLEGVQLTVDNETQLILSNPDLNDPHISLSKTGSSTHIFATKKLNRPVSIKASTTKKKINLTVRHYQNDSVQQTDYYQAIEVKPNATINIHLDPSTINPPQVINQDISIQPTSTTQTQSDLDQTPPQTQILVTGNTVTLFPTDPGTGTLQTEYSLDNGQTVNLYTNPFQLPIGNYTLQVTSTDKAGNQEIPQTQQIVIQDTTFPPTQSPSSITLNPSPPPAFSTNKSSSNVLGITTAATSIVTPPLTKSPITALENSLLENILANKMTSLLFFLLIIVLGWSMVKP